MSRARPPRWRPPPALAVRHLYVALDLARRGSRRATRTTTCGPRSPSRGAVAPIAQAIGAAAVADRARASPPSGASFARCGPSPRARCPHLPTPRVPVVAVTGTNGKSTTTRLIAHIAREAGRQVGMTNSDGIYVARRAGRGRATGPASAAPAASSPSRASSWRCSRRRAAGSCCAASAMRANDVAVVTNVCADHLGLQGIDTARRAGRGEGRRSCASRSATAGSVLNADDPRVVGHAARDEGRSWYAVQPRPRQPAASSVALDRGGRAAIARSDGWLVLLRRRPPAAAARAASPSCRSPSPGCRSYNIANALAAAAAADALGIAAGEDRARACAPSRSTAARQPGPAQPVRARGRAGRSSTSRTTRPAWRACWTCRSWQRVAGRPAAARCGWRSARRATGPMRSSTASARLAGAAPTTSSSREAPLPARPRPRGDERDPARRGRRRPATRGEVEAYPSELAALQALLAARPARRRGGGHDPRRARRASSSGSRATGFEPVAVEPPARAGRRLSRRPRSRPRRRRRRGRSPPSASVAARAAVLAALQLLPDVVGVVDADDDDVALAGPCRGRGGSPPARRGSSRRSCSARRRPSRRARPARSAPPCSPRGRPRLFASSRTMIVSK